MWCENWYSFQIGHRPTISWLRGNLGFGQGWTILEWEFYQSKFNYKGFFRVLQLQIKHPCIFGSRISVASICFTYHAMSHVLWFLLHVSIFNTRILAYVHLSSRLAWLLPLRSGYVSLSKWFLILYMVDWRNNFLMFSRQHCLFNFSYLFGKCLHYSY